MHHLAENRLQRIVLLGLFVIVSLVLHLNLISELNIVEDESGYMQDAAQITWDVLPLRDFGGTKGPLFLFALKLWQLSAGSGLEINRLFAIGAHLASIVLLYILTRRVTLSGPLSFASAGTWAVLPFVVNMTTNVMHFPLEICLVLGSAILLAGRNQRWYTLVAAALLFFLAILTRATAIGYTPFLLALLYVQSRSLKSLVYFGLAGLGILLLAVAIIYPLYGWPKTAYFFNLEALVIASKQRAVYETIGEPTSFAVTAFRSALPAWREGLLAMLSALFLPLLYIAHVRYRLIAYLLLGLLGWQLGPILLDDMDTWWHTPKFELQWIANRITVVFTLGFATWLLYIAPTITRLSRKVLFLLLAWVGGYILLYSWWGREVTPYYILEASPAIAIATAYVLHILWTRLHLLPKNFSPVAKAAVVLIIGIAVVAPYKAAAINQYRGTIEVPPAKIMAKAIQQAVPEGTPLFTGQPGFAYLGHRPLYGNYTHPGWYLSERAGYLASDVRATFLPDFDVLAKQVTLEVDWILVDWRTRDIYFNPGREETKVLRDMLENDFVPVITVPNETSSDITLYRRK